MSRPSSLAPWIHARPALHGVQVALVSGRPAIARAAPSEPSRPDARSRSRSAPRPCRAPRRRARASRRPGAATRAAGPRRRGRPGARGRQGRAGDDGERKHRVDLGREVREAAAAPLGAEVAEQIARRAVLDQELIERRAPAAPRAGRPRRRHVVSQPRDDPAELHAEPRGQAAARARARRRAARRAPRRARHPAARRSTACSPRSPGVELGSVDLVPHERVRAPRGRSGTSWPALCALWRPSSTISVYRSERPRGAATPTSRSKQNTPSGSRIGGSARIDRSISSLTGMRPAGRWLSRPRRLTSARAAAPGCGANTCARLPRRAAPPPCRSSGAAGGARRSRAFQRTLHAIVKRERRWHPPRTRPVRRVKARPEFLPQGRPDQPPRMLGGQRMAGCGVHRHRRRAAGRRAAGPCPSHTLPELTATLLHVLSGP